MSYVAILLLPPFSLPSVQIHSKTAGERQEKKQLKSFCHNQGLKSVEVVSHMTTVFKVLINTCKAIPILLQDAKFLGGQLEYTRG